MIKTYTPGDLPTLTLPGDLPGLLEGWVGWIERRVRRGAGEAAWEPAVVHATPPRDVPGSTVDFFDPRGGEYPLGRWGADKCRLPLSRPEARFRVAAWLAAHPSNPRNKAAQAAREKQRE